MAQDEKPTRVELPAVDPTKNVMDLVVARFQHLQDLLTALENRVDKTFTFRDTLRAKEFDQIKGQLRMQDGHVKEMAEKEKERLDAIRVKSGCVSRR